MMAFLTAGAIELHKLGFDSSSELFVNAFRPVGIAWDAEDSDIECSG